ncbi:hypothetical protein SEA_PETERSON_79 [Mycobacterium phage Peterson]|nr:hypothetical protein SEA_PETERSON_79 [Mycobacterium phage Peterson]
MNDELRAVLTEAQSEHRPVWAERIGMLVMCKCGHGRDIAGYDEDSHEAHVADAIASLPGVAVIQLPEATHSGTVSTSFRRATAWRKIPQVRGENRLVTLDDPGRCMNPDEARILAADLLAAAAVVAAGEEHHG